MWAWFFDNERVLRRSKNDPWADVRREARRNIRRRTWSRAAGTAALTIGIIVVAAIGVGATPNRILHRLSSHSSPTVATDGPTGAPSTGPPPDGSQSTSRTGPSGSPSPSSAPTLFGMESAEVGDCLLWNPNGVAVSMHKVSCGKAHRAEVTEMVDVSHQFTRWPGTAALQKAIEQHCPDALHHYAPSRPADPVVLGWGVMPLEQAWTEGDHLLVCTAENPSQGLLTGSVKSSSPVVLSTG